MTSVWRERELSVCSLGLYHCRFLVRNCFKAPSWGTPDALGDHMHSGGWESPKFISGRPSRPAPLAPGLTQVKHHPRGGKHIFFHRLSNLVNRCLSPSTNGILSDRTTHQTTHFPLAPYDSRPKWIGRPSSRRTAPCGPSRMYDTASSAHPTRNHRLLSPTG